MAQKAELGGGAAGRAGAAPGPEFAAAWEEKGSGRTEPGKGGKKIEEATRIFMPGREIVARWGQRAGGERERGGFELMPVWGRGGGGGGNGAGGGGSVARRRRGREVMAMVVLGEGEEEGPHRGTRWLGRGGGGGR